MASTPALSAAKTALLDRWRRGRAHGLTGGAIPRRPEGTDPPLSFAQERIWTLHRLAPGLAVHIIVFAVELPVEMDAGVLRQTLNEVVRRNEVLRACFPLRGGRPVQEILPSLELDLPLVDLRRLEPEEREAEARRLAEREVVTLFDIEHGPLLRAQLLRFADDRHRLLMSVHHVVADSSAVGFLGLELLGVYIALASGQPPPPLPAIQYGDYACWQRSPAEEARRSHQMDYFRSRLQDAPPALELPTDRPRPPVLRHEGDAHHFHVPTALAASLRTVSRGQGATLFMAVLAAFYVLLHRYSRQTDIVVGSPVLGRNQPELAELVGCFINTLALRTDLAGDPTFNQLLRRVRDTVRGAYANQEVPTEQLVRELRIKRDPSRMPLFQVMFNWHTGGSDRLDAGVSALPVAGRLATGAIDGFDLVLEVMERPDGLHADLLYPSALFEAASIERMGRQFEHLLVEAAADPERRISELPLVDPVELAGQLAEWNATTTARPAACLHQLFEAQATRSPAAVAVEFEGEELTYEELNRRANQAAHRLAGLGIAPEDLIGIAAERSAELVVGLLGILKAGAGYVPLDGALPAARLSAIMADTGIKALVGRAAQLERLPSAGIPTVRLDADRALLDALPRHNPDIAVKPHNVAYVIYTSGSTGRPKGIQVEHRSILNRLLWTIEAHGFSAQDRFLQKTPISFDASIWELFVPLFIGARLVLARPDGHQDPRYLARVIEEREVTVLQVVPSMLRLMLDTTAFGRLPSLRQVFAGGEALPPDLKQRFYALSGARLHNLYGPTEASIDVASSACDSTPGTPVAIGRPIANSRLYVLDPMFNPVPPGIPGELHVAGAGLARGYLRQPALTADKFLPDPFSSEFGGRIYATGDLVRHLADGSLQFLGRLDGQLKLRGFRIELGEVEQALLDLADVREAAAVAHGSGDERRLVAYVTAREGASLDPAALRSSLKDRLPAYMVPAAVVTLEELPRLPSGKIDRRALPAPQPAGPRRGQAEPSTPTEQRLAAAWAELLPAAPAAQDDDFFDLGGDSLLAVRLASRVLDIFGVELPLAAVFERPSLRALAAYVDQLSGGGPAAHAELIACASREGQLPLSFAQQRLWFLEHFVPGRPYYNLPVPVRLRGPLNVAALRRSLNQLVRRHEVLRASFPDIDGRPVQVFAAELVLELPITDVSHLGEADVRALVEEKGSRTFDLARGPVVRAELLRLGEDDHLLLLVVHHIAGDGWSTRVLVREVGFLYKSFSSGAGPLLPEPQLQYFDYACWQRRRLQGDHLDAELNHWKERLKGAPALLDLPTDHARPVMQSYRSGHVPFVIDVETRNALEALGRDEGATLFMTLLTGLFAVLSRHTGQEDIVLGAPVAGRLRKELEELVGFFVNTLPLRCDLSGDPDFRRLLRRVKDSTLDALAHQEIPFEKLVEELESDRDLSRTPLFQAMFAFQQASLPGVAAGGLQLEPVSLEVSPTRCDLTLYLLDTGRELRGSFEYVADLFDPERIERLAGHLQRLLAGAVAEPDARLSRLALLDDSEQSWLVDGFNRTAGEYRREAGFMRLFEEQARRTPTAVAVACGAETVTYAELEERVNQLAASLSVRGVGRETVVAVLAERGSFLLTSLLALLRLGAAYLPLDPEAPAPRLATVLDQSRTPLVMASPNLRASLDAALGAMRTAAPEVLFAGTPAPPRRRQPLDRPGPRGLAYVIFTSGSTGVPKGAMVEQGSMLNHLTAKVRELGLGPADCIAQTASQAFDISLWQLLAGLLVGARTQFVSEEATHDPDRLLAAVSHAGITVLEVVPSMLAMILDHLESSGTAPSLELLRVLVVTGEPLPPNLCRRWLARYPAIPIVNAYGPTECADDVTHHSISEMAPGEQRTPIGRPLLNTQLYVLQRAGDSVDLCPRGAVGELCVCGDGVGRGYLGDPRRTAISFVPDPFARRPGNRMYRTGDLVRHRSDGTLEHLGRTDHQVKVRGHRVELGEIEAALASCPGIRDAAVVAREDQPGQPRLVAYYVQTEAAATSVEELRGRLQERLPTHMVPAAWVPLASMPLTANGKLDRKALPAAEMRPDLEEVFQAPATPAEVLIARLWAELLGVERVGANDNFFALGGHSLLAMQLVSRLRRAFRLEVPQAAVFQDQTVAALTRALTAAEPRPGYLNRVAEMALRVESMSSQEVSAALASGSPA